LNSLQVLLNKTRLSFHAATTMVRLVFFHPGAPALLQVLNGKPVRSARAIPALPPQR
jgi:hypothetical protein